jgi:hypothetical protein
MTSSIQYVSTYVNRVAYANWLTRNGDAGRTAAQVIQEEGAADLNRMHGAISEAAHELMGWMPPSSGIL